MTKTIIILMLGFYGILAGLTLLAMFTVLSVVPKF